MNTSTLVMLFVPIISIPLAHFISKRQRWTDLAVSLIVGCLGMLILGLAGFIFATPQGFWELWAYGGVTSFLSAWLTLYSKNMDLRAS